MARVLLPEGTAPSRTLPGLILPEKPGQRRSCPWPPRQAQNNDRSSRTAGLSDSHRGEIRTSWSAVLFEGGEHGKLAARMATQVIKAYVDKQRRQPTKVASRKCGVGRVWNGGLEGEDEVNGGRFDLDVPKNRAPLAVAAPG